MHIAAVDVLDAKLLPALRALRDTLDAKARAFFDIVMIGRTHLMDATPVTLGQVISGWVAQLDDACEVIEAARDRLYPLALGGTAVGTGLNAHPNFGDAVAAAIARETGKPFVEARNKFAALSAHDAIVNASAAVRTLAVAAIFGEDQVAYESAIHGSNVSALARTLMWVVTAVTAWSENEPGSSIMPGKVNPTQSEALTMVVTRVFGNDATVAFAGSQGNFQLNVYKPVMLQGTLESIELLADALASFDVRCARGIEPNRAQIRENVERSLMLVTALNPHIGYENAARIALTAHREDLSLRDAAHKLGLLKPEDFDRLVDPAAMTRPG